MANRLTKFLACLVLLSTQLAASGQDIVQNTVKHLCVLTYDAGQYQHKTTGTFVNVPPHQNIPQSDGVVVTCAHLLEDWDSPHGKMIYVDFRSGDRFMGKIILLDRRGDICLLHIKGRPNLTGVFFAGTPDRRGERRWHIGMEGAVRLRVEPSILTDTQVNYGDMVSLNRGSMSGMSGGPIIDPQGDVRGVISASDEPMGVPTSQAHTIGCSTKRMLETVGQLFPGVGDWKSRASSAPPPDS